MGLMDCVVMMMADLFTWTTATLYVMPPFVPNQYMLDTHQDKGEYDWEIYAWCIRDVIRKSGDFGLCEMAVRDKLAYERFMKGITDSMTY